MEEGGGVIRGGPKPDPGRCRRCAGVSLRSPLCFLLRTAPEDSPQVVCTCWGQGIASTGGRRPAPSVCALQISPQGPPTANRQPTPTATHCPILFLWCCVLPMSCPCLAHETESVPVNVRFCWRYEPLFFLLKDSPGAATGGGTNITLALPVDTDSHRQTPAEPASPGGLNLPPSSSVVSSSIRASRSTGGGPPPSRPRLVGDGLCRQQVHSTCGTCSFSHPHGGRTGATG